MTEADLPAYATVSGEETHLVPDAASRVRDQHMSVLRFDDTGKLVEHRDYDNHVERRQAPYADW